MKLKNNFTIDAPVEKAWEALNTPETVAPCFPGATLTEYEGDSFTGTVKVKLGPIAMTYKGKGTYVSRDEDAHEVIIDASGRDSRGNGTATAKVTASLAADGPDRTTVAMVTDMTVTGKPAQFGRGVISDVADKIIGQFAACVARKLALGAEAAPAAAEGEGGAGLGGVRSGVGGDGGGGVRAVSGDERRGGEHDDGHGADGCHCRRRGGGGRGAGDVRVGQPDVGELDIGDLDAGQCGVTDLGEAGGRHLGGRGAGVHDDDGAVRDDPAPGDPRSGAQRGRRDRPARHGRRAGAQAAGAGGGRCAVPGARDPAGAAAARLLTERTAARAAAARAGGRRGAGSRSHSAHRASTSRVR